MKLESSAFQDHKPIPQKHTCDGEDISPTLQLRDVPKETVTLALIVDDPDAPMGTFDHWIAWNIPGETSELAEGCTMPIQGLNHFKELRYRGPCPPPGAPHRYFFKLYALDFRLDLDEGASKERLQEAMEGHILAKAELVGTYQRGG